MDLWTSIKSNSTTSGYNISRTKLESKIYEGHVEDASDKPGSYQMW
jgi:hypothetical protein